MTAFVDPHRKMELEALAKAIRDGGDREVLWRGVDLSRHFSPEATITAPREGVSRRMLSAIAAVVVFIPIGWTWWGLRNATALYQAWLASDLTGEQSFLQLWTHGFNGALAAHMTLPNVAFVSAVLIMVSMLLVLLERVSHGRQETVATREWSRKSTLLGHALLGAQLVLDQTNTDTPAKGVDLLRETAERLVTVNHSVLKGADALVRATTQLEQDTAKAGHLLKQSVTQSANDLQKAAKNSAGVLRKAMGDSATELEKSVSNAVSGLTESATSMSAASAELSQAAGSVAGSQDQLVRAATEMGRHTRELGQSMSQATESLDNRLSQRLAEMSTKVAELQNSTQEVAEALTLHTGAAQHQIGELTQIRAGLAHLVPPSGGNGNRLQTAPGRSSV